MIAKLVKGKGFRGALAYDLQPGKGRLLETNMAGRTPRELAAEFGAIRQLRPTLGKAVLHVSLSAAPGEHLTDAQWRAIGQRYLQAMGLTANQYVLTRHTDTGHEHVHLLANRIQFDGQVTSDRWDYRRQEAVLRTLERDYGLTPVAPSREAARRALTTGELQQSLRTGVPSTRSQLHALVGSVVREAPTLSAFVEQLETVGVTVVPNVARTGHVSGLSYQLDGVTLKGSDLGKGYTWQGIQRQGVSYDQERDGAALRRGRDRAAAGADRGRDRDLTAGEAPERGGVRRALGAAGAGDGGADGRDAGHLGRGAAGDAGARRDGAPAIPGRGAGVEHRGGGGGARRPGPGAGGPAAGMGALWAGGGDGPAYGGARDRLLALAGAAADRDPARSAGRGGAPEVRLDRTAAAVHRHVAALGVARVELGLRDPQTGQLLQREWSPDEVAQHLPWLKRMNARGQDIYVRPAGAHGLVLVDDLTPQALQQMRRDGWQPAATIETSPGNYQAWVKLSAEPLAPEVRRRAAQELAQAYGGDPHSADSRHYGRLAGFTNQKPEHTRAGQQPYVLVREASGQLAPRAPAALARIGQALEQEALGQERATRLARLRAPEPLSPTSTPLREYQRQAQRLLARYGPEADLSRMDWMIATAMAQSRQFRLSEIEAAIREASPNLASRKAGHLDDYARRTADKAWAHTRGAPQAAREEERHLERGGGRGRGFGFGR